MIEIEAAQSLRTNVYRDSVSDSVDAKAFSDVQRTARTPRKWMMSQDISAMYCRLGVFLKPVWRPKSAYST